jgi:cold shock protein
LRTKENKTVAKIQHWIANHVTVAILAQVPTQTALRFLPRAMPTGVVKKFFGEKGFGFITPDDGSRDVFVHRKVNGDDNSAYLEEGDKVNYEVEWDAQRGNYKASSCDGFKSGADGGGGGLTYRHRSYRKVTAAGVGKTRTRIKPVLPADHPLVLKRKAENAKRQKTA